MSFLAPLFLIGTLAVALPVIFHLVRRSSKEQIPFSSLMFLQPAPPRVTKRSRLEHLLLLLLRCLVVCLLALGFSRPFFQRPMTASPLSEETGRKVVVLVDTSASMKREGLWSEALGQAEAALKQTGPGDQVAVLTFDRRVRTLVSFEQWNQMDIGQRATLTLARISDLKPNWSSTQLGSALIAAAEAFADADKEGRSIGRRQIILISDMQEGSRLDGLQGYEWPRGIEVQVEAVQPKRPTNAGVQWLAANDDSANAGTNLVTRIRVSNSANATREQFKLHWADAPSAAPLDVYVPPGQSRIVPAPTLPPDTVGEQLVLTGDDDDFDNTVYVLQPKAEHINIIFAGDEPENDSAQPFFYLKRAFQPTARQIVEVEARTSAAELPPADLADARLLVVADHLSDSRMDAVQKFMTGGGTVLFVMKNTAAADDIGRLAGTNGFAADEVTPPNYALFGMIDFNHPLFAPFADARFNDFTKIHFWKYRRVDAAKLPGARVLAKFDSGDPAVLEIPRGNGRLLVLTSGWEPADSQLAVSSKFVPLLYSTLDLSGGIHTTLAQFHIDDEVNLAGLMPGVTTSAISVKKPDGTMVQLAAGETRFSDTDRPGIYSVTTLQPPIRFAVNLDGAESRTAMLPGDELQRLGVPMKAREVALSTQVEQKRRLHDAELEDRQKLWRWLTLTALVVLLGETFVAGWLTRRTAVQTGAQS
ncbi:MAG TPA: BatA domain-containing protein [Verrucomicrobiae bacterium]|nr:BatA domain-containing protein [Verrucomicrobiae bacterium]